MINSAKAIIEIRAGAGGEEAALFAKDLFLAYQRFAQQKGWKEKIFDLNLTDLGGYKRIIFSLQGENVWPMMKYEGGVHRVQRIPKTEKGGRIHTSTVSVAVLPEDQDQKIELNPADLKISFYKSSGPGGQNVNKRQTAVRITHLPTDLTVSCQSERDQVKNRENALKILKAKVFQYEEERKAQAQKSLRKEQAGQMERAQKIRTYNFQRNQLKDHRLKKSWSNLEEIITKGDWEPLIKQLQKKLASTPSPQE
jgi:peptide chain release factor 1